MHSSRLANMRATSAVKVVPISPEDFPISCSDVLALERGVGERGRGKGREGE